MVTYIFSKSKLDGTIKSPSSKAYTHRAVIGASLSRGTTLIKDPLVCEDTLTSLKATKRYGAKIRKNTNRWAISGGVMKTPDDIINCRGSGTTLRFITPLLSFCEGISILTGNRSLRKRPNGPLLEAMQELGVKCFSAHGKGLPPLIIFGGGMRGGETSIVGNVSSQFISGLLLAAPKTRIGIDLRITTKLESSPYVRLTEKILFKHGITVHRDHTMRRFTISSGQEYKPTVHEVRGDYSSAAFLMAAAAVTSSKIKISNLPSNTFQADEEIINILDRMGVSIIRDGDLIEVTGGDISGIEINALDIPDLVPVCAVLGCFASGRTTMKNVKRLQIKESDRIKTLITELRKAGVNIYRRGDDLIVEKAIRPRPSIFSSHNDHRIAMACSILALALEGESHLVKGECVMKSYPNFFNDLKYLGGRINAV